MSAIAQNAPAGSHILTADMHPQSAGDVVKVNTVSPKRRIMRSA